MGRRREGEEVAFGSDSFLDVLANIVGILIILIVIAGVRVIQTPVSKQTEERADAELAAISPAPPADQPLPDELPTEPSAPDEVVTAPPSVEESPQDDDDAVTAASDVEESVDPPTPREPPPLSEELVRAVKEREEDIRELERRRDQLVEDTEALQAEQTKLEQRLSAARDALTEKQDALSRARLVLAEQEESLESQRGEVATLQVTLAEVRAAEPEPTVLKHRLTPVGRVVTGHELHFLLSEGRIAFVPFDELAAEVVAHFRRRKSHILQTPQYVGSIGPVRGFRMDFVIQSQPLSIIEELRMGASGARLGLTHWQVHPQAGIIAETAAQALHPQSRFLEVLRTADLGSTLTFWVYPDSFALHRELQEFVHRQGFEVAARPLPEGVPIAGGPQGSRSVAQ